MPKLVQMKDKDGLVFPKTAISENILIARRKNNQTIMRGAIEFPVIEKSSNYFKIENNNSRFIAKKSVMVLIIGNLNFYSQTTGFFIRAGIFKNGEDIGNRVPISKIATWQPIQINGIITLSENDYIEIHSVSDGDIEIASNNEDGSFINIIPIL